MGRGQRDWRDSMCSPPGGNHPFAVRQDSHPAANAPRGAPGTDDSYHSRGQEYSHGRGYSPGKPNYSPGPGRGRSHSPGPRPGCAGDWPAQQGQEQLSEQQQRWLRDMVRQWRGETEVATALEGLCLRLPAVLAELAGSSRLVSDLEAFPPHLALLCLLHVQLSSLTAVRNLSRFLSGLMRSMKDHFHIVGGCGYRLREYSADLQLLVQLAAPPGGYARSELRPGDVPYMVSVWESHPVLKRILEGLYTRRALPERSSIGPLHLALLDDVARKGRIAEAEEVVRSFSRRLSLGNMANEGAVFMTLLSDAAGRWAT